MSKNIIPFNYFGGKFNHCDWIVRRLPVTKSYVEVFGGSGVILFNRKPSRIETYNDINSTVVNFFRVLREHPQDLIEKIYLTPYSQEEYFNCFNNLNEGDDLERARRFFVAVNMSFNGTYRRQTGWKMSTKESISEISEAVSRWLSKVPNLEKIIDRLKTVQICNLDFREIFKKFDDPETLFYCDPPYMHSTRYNNQKEYDFEMTDSDHEELLNIIKSLKGMVAVSGYTSELYNDKLKDFYRMEAREKRASLQHNMRREILWTNYDPAILRKDLFHAA